LERTAETPAAAEQLFREGLELARKQAVLSWELG